MSKNIILESRGGGEYWRDVVSQGIAEEDEVVKRREKVEGRERFVTIAYEVVGGSEGVRWERVYRPPRWGTTMVSPSTPKMACFPLSALPCA
jgi:hypothetical protein